MPDVVSLEVPALTIDFKPSMADVEEFSAASFDAKAWVNANCSSRPGEEPLERYVQSSSHTSEVPVHGRSCLPYAK